MTFIHVICEKIVRIMSEWIKGDGYFDRLSVLDKAPNCHMHYLN